MCVMDNYIFSYLLQLFWYKFKLTNRQGDSCKAAKDAEEEAGDSPIPAYPEGTDGGRYSLYAGSLIDFSKRQMMSLLIRGTFTLRSRKLYSIFLSFDLYFLFGP